MQCIKRQGFLTIPRTSCSSNQVHFALSKETHDKGIYTNPDGYFKLSCYVESDFGGLFGSKDSGNPASVKSRTGYITKFGNVPILWVSKLQTQIVLSAMEPEYIALSQSMRDLIPL